MSILFRLSFDLESCDFSWSDLLEDPGELLDCDPGIRMEELVVLAVTDVLVSPSSVVTEFCDDVSMESDREFVEPQSSSFSKKKNARWLDWVDSQEEMRYEGSPLKAPPPFRRRMMPPTPQQSSSTSIEEMQWQTGMEEQGSSWSARERTVIARMENYLNKSDDMKLEIEELDLLMGSKKLI